MHFLCGAVLSRERQTATLTEKTLLVSLAVEEGFYLTIDHVCS